MPSRPLCVRHDGSGDQARGCEISNPKIIAKAFPNIQLESFSRPCAQQKPPICGSDGPLERIILTNKLGKDKEFLFLFGEKGLLPQICYLFWITPMSPLVSIIVPLKDEAENVEHLAEEVTSAMDGKAYEWECIWVDDGSSDGTLALLERLAHTDSRHRFLSFERNSGQSAALHAGFEKARGEILATIDGDGQNDPRDIPGLVEMIRSGETDMANGYRAMRHDDWLRRISSRTANALRNKVTGKTVRDTGCSTRAMKRQCVAHLPLFSGMHRFLPTLVALGGWRIAETAVNHRPRLRGESKYGVHNRLWIGLVDLFGVLWLKKRKFSYRICKESGEKDRINSS